MNPNPPTATRAATLAKLGRMAGNAKYLQLGWTSLRDMALACGQPAEAAYWGQHAKRAGEVLTSVENEAFGMMPERRAAA